MQLRLVDVAKLYNILHGKKLSIEAVCFWQSEMANLLALDLL